MLIKTNAKKRKRNTFSARPLDVFDTIPGGEGDNYRHQDLALKRPGRFAPIPPPTGDELKIVDKRNALVTKDPTAKSERKKKRRLLPPNDDEPEQFAPQRVPLGQ